MSIGKARWLVVCASLVLAVVVSGVAGELGAAPLVGDQVGSELAVRVARHTTLSCEHAGALMVGPARPIRGAGGRVLAYCVDLLPTGYVIVSGSRQLPPVLAYSFTSDAGVDEPGNPLFGLVRGDMEARVAQAAALPAGIAGRWQAEWAAHADGSGPPRAAMFEQWPPAGSTPTGGWLTTNWDQGSPYNSLCPMDSTTGQRSLAGCPAVAMAQIVHYHARLNGTTFTDADDYYHNYGGNQYWIDDAYASRGFPSFPQLNTHLAGLFDHYFYGTTPTSTRRAALIFACGVAATQVYTSSGSGTFGVSQAYEAFQKFRCSTAELLDSSDPDLYTRLTANMMDAYPAHLAVVNASWTVGHNLVVDGYNTDGYYHLNFGWSGSYNGWYLLPSGLPFSLTVIEGVIVDIMTDACAPMDCNCDSRVSWTDFGYFRTCMLGPASAYTPPGCTAFDNDADEDVDLQDFSVFQSAFDSAAG